MVLTPQPGVARLDVIEDLHEVPADLHLALQLRVRHLVDHVVGHLAVQLAQRVQRRQAQVVAGRQHAAVLLDEALEPAHVVGVYLLELVRQSDKITKIAGIYIERERDFD